MDIGISTFPTDYSADVAVIAKRAEELGFDSFWVPEHPILPVNASSPWPGSADGIIPNQCKGVLLAARMIDGREPESL